jgi:hypothetical protein
MPESAEPPGQRGKRPQGPKKADENLRSIGIKAGE